MNISYTRIGDYYIPNIKISNKKEYKLGKYGLLKLEYLKEHNKPLYNILLMKNELNNYLHKVDVFAKNKEDELIKQLAEKENVDENLKEINQMLWVGNMNNIKNRVEEIVLREYIYYEK